MNNLMLVGLGVVAVSTILCIIATAIPSWMNDDRTNAGLWKICKDAKGFCDSYKYVNVPLQASRVMMILSILAFAASSACAAVYAFFLRSQPKYVILAALSAFIAGDLSLMGAITFWMSRLYSYFSSIPLGAGFGLAIVVYIMGMVGGLLLLIGSRRNVSH